MRRSDIYHREVKKRFSGKKERGLPSLSRAAFGTLGAHLRCGSFLTEFFAGKSSESASICRRGPGGRHGLPTLGIGIAQVWAD